MKINGISLTLNMADADVSERFEKEIIAVSERMEQISDDLSHAQMVRAQCHIIFDCFNHLFGDGTDKRIFGERTDLLQCLEAYEKLIAGANLEKEKINDKIADMSKRFSKK